MSGWLYAVATDPVVRSLVDSVEPSSEGTARAAADDVGVALETRAALVPLRWRFQVVERAAGLRFKPHKCALAPLWAPFSPAMEFEMRRGLVEVIPDWGRSNIVSAARYLGFLMGPGGGARSWAAPVAKWTGRAARIGASGAPAGVAAQLYSTIAMPVLGYIVQDHCPPPPPPRSGGSRKACGRARAVPPQQHTLGRRWHIEIAAAGGGRFGSRQHHSVSCAGCAPDCARLGGGRRLARRRGGRPRISCRPRQQRRPPEMVRLAPPRFQP